MPEVLTQSRTLKERRRHDGMCIQLLESAICNLFFLVRSRDGCLLESKTYSKSRNARVNRLVEQIARKDFNKWKTILVHKLDNDGYYSYEEVSFLSHLS